MNKHNLIIALACLHFGINAAEKCILTREQDQNTHTTPAITASSSLTFQEWPAQDYANGNKMQITAFSQFLEDNRIDYTNKRVVSIGCGTGELEAKLASKATYVLGIDASSNMIKYANNKHLYERAENDGMVTFTPNVNNLHFLRCPAENFRAGEKFDLAISSFAFHWFSDKQKAIQNIANNLEAEGLFFVNIPTADNPKPLHFIVAQEIMPTTEHFNSGSLIKTHVIEMFTQAGFEILKIEDQSFTWNPTKEEYSKRQWPLFESRFPIAQSMTESEKKSFFNEIINRCLAKLPQNEDGTYKDVYTGTIVLARKK